ncbi:hypothetical protein PR202_ga24444 [Eleusine coracana subsp. coracana]|uniref:F-box domain-containing protein n=1 Tax=Eleusine coracana subsp. coracana TaxID=191504 RepID=A0AAV5D6X0_ELECO|nr:hypothetical protein PR202_ga24444 [Eleusine coracana subsp. coracana]
MPISTTSSQEAMGKAGEDLISALPDDVLHLLLSFLPSDDAVRTSVVAHRWRHLWKSARAIRVYSRGSRVDGWTQRTLTRFVNHLLAAAPSGLLARRRMRHQLRRDEDLSDAAGLWIRHAVSFCEAKVLRFSVRTNNRLGIPDVPFVSENLARVEIANAKLDFDTLDFSRCPALEVLDCSTSRINVGRILSPSLRRLRLDDCYFTGETRTRISTPRLVSLHVTVSFGWAPFLDDMPMRDCQFCTMFINLKTLLLNEWCVTPDLGALVYFLRYTPVLEKLTLGLEFCHVRIV